MLNQDLSELWQRTRDIESKTLYFLGGMPKSGTTWVERIYDAHPNAACKGESHFGNLLVPRLVDCLSSYNDQIGKKGNWTIHNNSGVDQIHESRFKFTDPEALHLLRQAILLMLQKWDVSGDIQCIGEKTPSNSDHFKLLYQLFPEAKFIYIIRDPRDVIVSAWHFNRVINAIRANQGDQELDTYARTVARAWTQNVKSCLGFIYALEDQGTYIRYEDILASPRDEIRFLYDFLGLDASDQIVNGAAGATSFKMMSGGRESGQENRKSFYRKGVAGDWQNFLRKETEGIIVEEAGETMAQLGYTV